MYTIFNLTSYPKQEQFPVSMKSRVSSNAASKKIILTLSELVGQQLARFVLPSE